MRYGSLSRVLDDEDLAVWVAGLDDLFALVAGRFPRVEPRLQARAYVRGLLAPLAGQEQLDAGRGGREQDAGQDAAAAEPGRPGTRTASATTCAATWRGTWATPAGCWSWTRPGSSRRGPGRRGCSGSTRARPGGWRTASWACSCAYASPKGRALIDRELYLPKSWTDDRDRCREAGVPDDVQFASKTELARLMLGRALDAGVPACLGDRGRGLRQGREVPELAGAAPHRLRRRRPEEPGRRRRRREVPRRRADRARPGPGMEAPQLRERLQRAPGLRLGGRDLARGRHRAARLVPVPAGPPLAHAELQGRAGTGLLPVLPPRPGPKTRS